VALLSVTTPLYGAVRWRTVNAGIHCATMQLTALCCAYSAYQGRHIIGTSFVALRMCVLW
jgi:hypothetical protein